MQNFKVVIADDDDDIRELIYNLISPIGFKIFTAKDGKAAHELIEKERPDILITDVDMPYMSGYDICKEIKANKGLDFIYVIIVTGTSISSDEISLGFDYGADDFITKPFNNKEFMGRVKSAVRIKTLHNEVLHLSTTDSLTGLYNRRYFEQHSANEFYRSERYCRPISCLMIDVDFFKKVNDSYGHEAGDEVLKNVAGVLKTNLRLSDSSTLCRYGGEEFVALLPETSSAGAIACAENLRIKIGESKINYKGTEISVTASIGVSSLLEEPVFEGCDLLRYADIALYKAKESGRNCVKHISVK